MVAIVFIYLRNCFKKMFLVTSLQSTLQILLSQYKDKCVLTLTVRYIYKYIRLIFNEMVSNFLTWFKYFIFL